MRQRDQELETVRIRRRRTCGLKNRGRFTDADFAGDHTDTRSTSGKLLVQIGPHAFFPLSAQSMKQTAGSYGAVEAELVSCDHGLRMSGLPALTLWEKLLERKPT